MDDTDDSDDDYAPQLQPKNKDAKKMQKIGREVTSFEISLEQLRK